MRGKPKFTPDPPPNIEGLDTDTAFRMYYDWNQRQWNRAEDWWPKDQSENIALLQQLTGATIGTWPIIGYSSFNYEMTEELPRIAFTGQIGLVSGSDWTASTVGFDFNDTMTSTSAYEIRGIVDNQAGLFAAPGQDNTNGTGIYSTTDGTTWVRAGNPWSITNQFVRTLTWDAVGNRWIAFMRHPSPASGTGTYIRASTDLSTWSSLYDANTGTSYYLAGTDGAGTWLAGVDNLGSVDQLKFIYSTDNGANWTVTSTSPLTSIGGVESSGTARYAHDRWFFSSANRGALHMCDPGTDFTNSANWNLLFSTGSAFDTCSPVIAGFDGSGNKLYVLLRSVSSTPSLLRSTDGVNFSSVTAPVGLGGWPQAGDVRTNIAYDSQLGWIVVKGTNIYESTDALTWTASVDDGKFTNLANVAIGLNP